MDNPFSYGTTVSNQYFTNREEDLAELKASLLNGINTSIISPRRWGKSSLVEKVLSEIKKDKTGVKVVSIDMFAVNTEQGFCETFASECLKASSNLIEDWLKSGRDYFKNILPKFSMGIDPVTDFSVSFDWEESKKNVLEILNLPQAIAEKKGVKFIVAIDEFQNIMNFENAAAFEKKLRSVWQKQTDVTYCLFGSKRHMMNEIFNSSSKPFYRFGNIRFLKKIATEKWLPFIEDGFSRTGKSISREFAGRIVSEMQNHSWYVQQFSYFVWVGTEDKVTAEVFLNARQKIIESNRPFFMNLCENLSTKQVNLLKAVVKKQERITSAATIKTFDLGTSGTVVKNRKVLIEKDILDSEDGILSLQDPVFELWFRMVYFNENLY